MNVLEIKNNWTNEQLRNSNENKNMIISKWVEVDWVIFGKTLFKCSSLDLWSKSSDCQ